MAEPKPLYSSSFFTSIDLDVRAFYFIIVVEALRLIIFSNFTFVYYVFRETVFYEIRIMLRSPFVTVNPYWQSYLKAFKIFCDLYAFRAHHAGFIFSTALFFNYLLVGFLFKYKSKKIIVFTKIIDFIILFNIITFAVLTKYRLFYFFSIPIYMCALLYMFIIFNRFLDRVHSLVIKYDPVVAIVHDFFPFVIIGLAAYVYFQSYLIWVIWDFEYYMTHGKFTFDYESVWNLCAKHLNKGPYPYKNKIRKW